MLRIDSCPSPEGDFSDFIMFFNVIEIESNQSGNSKMVAQRQWYVILGHSFYSSKTGNREKELIKHDKTGGQHCK
jgi:hypothetical protein